MSDDPGFLGRGWSFPPLFYAANHSMRMSEGAANIRQSIALIIQTARGSRPLLPDFGCNLAQWLFGPLNAGVQEEIEKAVHLALLQNEPRIVVESVQVSMDQSGNCLQLEIAYLVSQTNTRHNNVFPFAKIEGSNLAPLAQVLE